MRKTTSLLWTIFGASTLVAGCAVNSDLSGWPCYSDDDCLGGQVCDGEDLAAELPGQCLLTTGGIIDCVDRDGDTFFVGSDCVSTLILDCDDDDQTINPDGTEACNGQDDNCDGSIDENPTDGGPIVRPCPLQAGLCLGSTTTCEDGSFLACTTGQGYPAEFQSPEATCDGIDNDCNNRIDENCACQPGIDGAFQCGQDTGTCSRGIALCQNDGTVTECFEAGIGSACTADAECGEGGFCVAETVAVNEDLFDDCGPPETSCTRNVCRTINSDFACADDSECAENELCGGGFCQTRNLGVVAESCNGEDDDCDGRIDNDIDRNAICGRCPFNSALIQVQSGQFICFDQYEASRIDATADGGGSTELYAQSVAGVMPWAGIAGDSVSGACGGDSYRALFNDNFAVPIAARRICTTFEWPQACGGVTGTASATSYPYGDDYVAGSCNDSSGATCPAPTGSTAACTRSFGASAVFDYSGNLSEWVKGPGDVLMLAGGSCSDSAAENLACDTFATAEVDTSTVGFRCCTNAR